MAELVYLLCAAGAFVITILLIRAFRRNRVPLLFWTAICFTGFLINNLLLVLDLLVFPRVDLYVVRAIVLLVGLMCLVVALIFERAGEGHP